MTDRASKFLALLERYALTVARRESAVDYQELRATEALADEQRAELLKFIGERWIPVSERLPEDYVSVLVFSGMEPFVAWHGSETPRWVTGPGKYVFCNEKYKHVTHWMPLPEPPEEKECQ